MLWSLPDDAPPARRTAPQHTLLGPARLHRAPLAAGRAVLLPARQMSAAGAMLLPADGGPVRLLPPPTAPLPNLTDLGRRTEPAARALHADALAALAAKAASSSAAGCATRSASSPA